jgi:hypothetical protein
MEMEMMSEGGGKVAWLEGCSFPKWDAVTLSWAGAFFTGPLSFEFGSGAAQDCQTLDDGHRNPCCCLPPVARIILPTLYSVWVTCIRWANSNRSEPGLSPGLSILQRRGLISNSAKLAPNDVFRGYDPRCSIRYE